MKTLRHLLRVAVFATRTDFGATRYRVPCHLRPFNVGFLGHHSLSQKFYAHSLLYSLRKVPHPSLRFTGHLNAFTFFQNPEHCFAINERGFVKGEVIYLKI